MTDLPTLATTLVANFRTIRIPALEDQSEQPRPSPGDWFQLAKARRADRRAADAHRDRIRRELVEHGYRQFLSHLERDPERGWRLHIFVADEAAIPLLDQIAAGPCGPGDPAGFDAEEFVMECLGRLGSKAVPE